MLKKILMSVLLMTLAINVAYAQITSKTLFENGKEGYKYYRIPSVLTTPNGTIFAFAEGRQDLKDSGNIDIVMKTSVDNGKIWSPLKVVYGKNDNNTWGNPCPVYDKTTGNMYLLICWNKGDAVQSDIVDGKAPKREVYQIVFRYINGKWTWSQPQKITEQVSPDPKKENWTWYATGPGNGIQKQLNSYKNRLIIPSNHTLKGSKINYAHLIYSDQTDVDKTTQLRKWHLGGISPYPNSDESAIAEQSDGSLIYNMRNQGNEVPHYRFTALSADGGSTLTRSSEKYGKILSPQCEASLIRYSYASDRYPGGVLLYSGPQPLNPSPPFLMDRVMMTVLASTDNGFTWKYRKLLFKGASAYSCMTGLPDEKVLCLYEKGYLDSGSFSKTWEHSKLEAVIFSIDDVIPKNINNNQSN